MLGDEHEGVSSCGPSYATSELLFVFFFAGLAHGHFNTQTNMGYSEGRVEAVRGREEGQVWSSPGQTRF